MSEDSNCWRSECNYLILLRYSSSFLDSLHYDLLHYNSPHYDSSVLYIGSWRSTLPNGENVDYANFHEFFGYCPEIWWGVTVVLLPVAEDREY